MMHIRDKFEKEYILWPINEMDKSAEKLLHQR